MRAEEGSGTEEEVFSVSLLHPRALYLVFKQFPRRDIGRNSDMLCMEHVQTFLSSFPKHSSAETDIAFTSH